MYVFYRLNSVEITIPSIPIVVYKSLTNNNLIFEKTHQAIKESIKAEN